jgi:hypothetical protein
MMPKRVQRKRSKGWRMPAGCVYVGRPTRWGNPYRAGVDGTAQECVNLYRALVSKNASVVRAELRGRDLACWCPLGSPCHVDVLLELANQPELSK